MTGYLSYVLFSGERDELRAEVKADSEEELMTFTAELRLKMFMFNVLHLVFSQLSLQPGYF